MKSSVLYRDQVNSLATWFQSWSECEQTVALCSILKKVSPSQSLFLIHILEQNILGNNDLAAMEEEANDPDFIRNLHSLPQEQALRQLLAHLPLLRTGNPDAKNEFLNILPDVLTQSIHHGFLIDECRQLLSYALIHPAINGDERSQFTLWLSQLEETSAFDAQSVPYGRYLVSYKDGKAQELDLTRPLGQVPGWECAGSRDSGIVANLSPRSSVPMNGTENGFTPLHSTLSAPPALQTAHSSLGDDRLNLLSVNRHMTVKRTKSLTPPINCQNGQMHQQYLNVHHSSDWALQQQSSQCQQQQQTYVQNPDFSSLSPQSSGSSTGSGSDPHDDSGKNAFLEDGSGMEDVPAWLKGLRLHKYAYLFQQLTYEQMMDVSEEWLESQKVTKGARNKILLSIKKLRERQATLRALEKDIMEGCNLRNALNEIKALVMTPLKAFTGNKPSTPTSPDPDTSIADGDLPGQFTRILGKVCTQILVSRHLEDEGVNLYLHLLDRCMSHEAFTPKQKKLLSSWAQQIQKIWYPTQKFPTDKTRKKNIDLRTKHNINVVWGGCTFPISNGSRCVRQLPKHPIKPMAPWQAAAAALQQQTAVKPRPPIFLAPPNHPALTKHNSLNSYMLQQSMQEMSAKRQLERTHSAPGCWGPGNNLTVAPEPGQEIVGDPDINARLDSLCLRMTEHALGGLDTADRGSTF